MEWLGTKWLFGGNFICKVWIPSHQLNFDILEQGFWKLMEPNGFYPARISIIVQITAQQT